MRSSCREKKTIFHVDMDHFFSAVEEREHPEFKGKPVVVGADPREGAGRGVVKTCNYEARKFMIHSGMPISKAWKLCPNAIYVRADYKLYREVSSGIMAVLRKYSKKFQQWGVDEAFLDVSSSVQDFSQATELAVCIKHDILWNEKLTCSIGVASNKLVAKIASDFEKPDGLTIVDEGRMESFLAPLPVRRMLWIGEKTESKLANMGIYTIGDLADHDVSLLVEKFGVMGRRYHDWAHGVYRSDVGNRKGMRKSMGHESTFSTNTTDPTLIIKRIDDACQRIHERAQRYKILFKTITIKLRYGDFQTRAHSKTLPIFTNNLDDLQKTVEELLQSHLQGGKIVRLVGVRVSNLKSSKGQETLN
jgi:DNA polymerase IV (DinB-like DNA polymerase)